eukprot:12406461-Karenia_brevis.AAC.1
MASVRRGDKQRRADSSKRSKMMLWLQRAMIFFAGFRPTWELQQCGPFMLMIVAWAVGLKGVCVGEASNPGPGAADSSWKCASAKVTSILTQGGAVGEKRMMC